MRDYFYCCVKWLIIACFLLRGTSSLIAQTPLPPNTLVLQLEYTSVSQIEETLSIDKKIYSVNQFSLLPPEIGTLNTLEDLNLMQNALTKHPSSIGNLYQLEALNLRSNQLNAIPKEIETAISLTTLITRSNQLKNIPTPIIKKPQ